MKRIVAIIVVIFSISTSYANNRELRIALLADLHITPNNNNDKIFSSIVEDINNQKFDLVIIAGDITNMGSNEELKCAYNHLRHIRHRQLITIGNHETTWSRSAGRDFKLYWGHNGCTTTSVGDYLFVAYPAGPFIKMADGTAQDGSRLAWVEEQLKRGKKLNKKIISVCHYPLNKDLTNRNEIVSLLKQYNVGASLCGHYHKPQLMSFDSLPGILGRSLMLKQIGETNYGYSILTLRNDSIYVAEKIINKPATPQYAIQQRNDRYVNSLPCDPQSEPLYYGNFTAERVIEDNAAIYTAAQVSDNILYYGNSAGEIKAYDIERRELLWCKKFKEPIYSTPTIYQDLLIVATLSEGVVALNRKTGKQIWKNRDGNGYIGNGIIDGDYLYIGANGAMRKINCLNGKSIWTFNFSDQHPQGRPTIAEGKLIFGAWDCNLYCVDCQTGSELWRWSNGSKNRLYSPGHIIPRVANNRVMIVAPDRYITNIDLNTGREIWRIKQRKVRESTGLSDDGKIFYAKTMDGEMIAVPMTTDAYTEQWCCDAGWGYDHSPCPLVVNKGVVYMTSRRGKVAAISEKGELLSVGKFANSTANDIRIDSNNGVWISFIEGVIWHLKPITQ